jgi:thiamine-monophosphate kinase
MKGEFEFINALRAKSRLSVLNPKIKIGIGDDCAVLKQNSRTDLVITTDLLVEDIDFRLAWTKPEFLGHRALTVSLSDVAAMGAKPLWALVSIGAPTEIWKSSFIEKFYEGWFDLAKKFNVDLIGGDISRTPDKIVIDSIVAGEVKKNQAILRSGAKAGDLIYVSGRLGGAAAGLKLLENGLRFDTAKNNFERRLLCRQICPNPQTEIAEILSEKRLATAMIDLSDGISSDLTHLCMASSVGANIQANKIPLDENISLIPELAPEALVLALNGGEDFELLFTVNPKNEKKLKNHLSDIFCIGEIIENKAKIRLLGNFKTVLLEPQGFRHF